MKIAVSGSKQGMVLRHEQAYLHLEANRNQYREGSCCWPDVRLPLVRFWEVPEQLTDPRGQEDRAPAQGRRSTRASGVPAPNS
jgi:hypothetical protein